MRKAALFSLLLCATPLAAAAKPPVVVELFTAQGCASCGEANANLAKMAQLIPIIGAPVGAVVNWRLTQRVGDMAINAYRMRRLG